MSCEAIRSWCNKFGQQYGNEIRRRRPRGLCYIQIRAMMACNHWERQWQNIILAPLGALA